MRHPGDRAHSPARREPALSEAKGIQRGPPLRVICKPTKPACPTEPHTPPCILAHPWPDHRAQLARDLGVGAATAIVVGTIIGSGIFLVPAEMMQAAGSAKLVYLAWIVGGLLSFFGALTYAELGAMKPQAGRRVRLCPRRLRPAPGFSMHGPGS